MRKAKKAARDLTWDEQMEAIIRDGGAGSTIEEVGGLGEFESDFETDEDELDWLHDRYSAETDYMTAVISDLIERLQAAGAALNLPKAKRGS